MFHVNRLPIATELTLIVACLRSSRCNQFHETNYNIIIHLIAPFLFCQAKCNQLHENNFILCMEMEEKKSEKDAYIMMASFLTCSVDCLITSCVSMTMSLFRDCGFCIFLRSCVIASSAI